MVFNIVIDCDFICRFGAKVVPTEVEPVGACSRSAGGLVADRVGSVRGWWRGRFGRQPPISDLAARGRTSPRDRRFAARRRQQHIERDAPSTTEPPPNHRQRRLRQPSPLKRLHHDCINVLRPVSSC